mgnify:CR=1 FL=1
MWREFFGLLGTAIAVVNGVFAIVIALMPVRRSVVKLRLGAAAMVLGAVAVGATFNSKYLAGVQQERQLVDRREIRERLQTFFLEGRALLGQIKDSQRELPAKTADEWAHRAEFYIRDNLGEPYAARFRKDANDMYGDAAVPPPRRC